MDISAEIERERSSTVSKTKVVPQETGKLATLFSAVRMGNNNEVIRSLKKDGKSLAKKRNQQQQSVLHVIASVGNVRHCARLESRGSC